MGTEDRRPTEVRGVQVDDRSDSGRLGYYRRLFGKMDKCRSVLRATATRIRVAARSQGHGSRPAGVEPLPQGDFPAAAISGLRLSEIVLGRTATMDELTHTKSATAGVIYRAGGRGLRADKRPGIS